jgi:hypothetical protein
MRMNLLLGLALLCGANGLSSAFAGGQAAPSSEDQAPEIEVRHKPEKKICVRDSTVGTRIAQRICLTRSDWKAREQQNEFERSRLLDKFNSTPGEKMLPGEPTGGGG